MKVLIIGLNHQIQSAAINSWGSSGGPQRFEREQKDHFAALVRSSIEDRKATLVAEEAKHGEKSLVELTCEKKCTYQNIEMAPEERAKRKIPAGYNENPETSDADKAKWNLEREASMSSAFLASSASVDSAILLCGRMHTEPIRQSLEQAGHAVETRDLLDEAWYVENWQSHMMML